MEQDNNIIEATPFTRATEDKSRSWIQIKPLQTAIGIIFLILAVAVGFMFTARAVSVVIDPQPDTFRFTSGFSYQLGERYLMLPGSYSFTAGKAGYHLLSTSIEVNQSADQNFSFTLEKLPGILKINTVPDVPATIFIDQQTVGTSPLTLDEISPGLHDITIRSDRYLDYDTEITIEGRRETQILEIPLSPAWADITLTSRPGDAEILVDDIVLGQTPDAVEVLHGERNIQIRKKGYKTWQTNIKVVASVNQVLDPIILVKSDGKVSIVSSPPGVNVNINGRYRGQTPIELALAPGKVYEITLSKAGYEPLQRKITVEPEQDISLNNIMSPILGIVRLMVEPAGSELFVDGKLMGDASQRLSLTANAHEIRILKQGYAEYVTRVTPQPGSSQQLFIRLQTEDEARMAAIPTSFKNGIGQTMKFILPAEFTMGASRREPGRRPNEIQKQVQLTRAYYLAATEVTNEQFNQFDPGHDSGILGRALLTGDHRPVVNLAWSKAVEFCNWLSQLDGLPVAYTLEDERWKAIAPINTGYRLPTEAEWAWAARYARGPEPTRFPWGNTMPPVEITANYADESAINMVPYHISGYNDSYRGPAPIETYAANEFGIHDLAGNVAEWIHDYFSVKIPRQTLVDPTGPENGDYHVIRGSSYKHGRFSELRWTYRDYGIQPRPDVGFRIARYLEGDADI